MITHQVELSIYTLSSKFNNLNAMFWAIESTLRVHLHVHVGYGPTKK